MPSKNRITIGPLKASEIAEADRIFRLAFSTFIGLPEGKFMAGRELMTMRLKGKHVKAVAARDNGKLIGSNLATRWGSFGFFGPLTVLPEYWDRGVGSMLMASTMKVFDAWGLKHTGLFTFPHSAKHIGLYQKFGYWPQYLTALMHWKPEEKAQTQPTLLSALSKKAQEDAIRGCARLASGIQKGLDLSEEIGALLKHRGGDVVLVYGGKGGKTLDGFAVCCTGPGSEGGTAACYVKFAAARGGDGAGERFDRLLEACESFAAERGVTIEAGVNLAREDAYRRMRAHGYRTTAQGVALQRPHIPGYCRSDAYVIDDWR
jgi:GNAT superfamily N-acetyltransferase